MDSFSEFLERAVDDTRYRIGAAIVAALVLLACGGLLIAANATPSKRSIMSAEVLPAKAYDIAKVLPTGGGFSIVQPKPKPAPVAEVAPKQGKGKAVAQR